MKIKVSELKQLVKEAVKNVLAERAQVNEEEVLREMIDEMVAEAFSENKANHSGGTFGDGGSKKVGPKDSHKAQPDSDSAFPLDEKKKDTKGKKPVFLKDKKKEKKIEEAPKAPKSKSAFPFKK